MLPLAPKPETTSSPVGGAGWEARGPRWLIAALLAVTGLLLLLLAGLLDSSGPVAGSLIYFAASAFILSARGLMASIAAFIVAGLLLLPIAMLFTINLPLGK